jgi:hypothetical protein
VDVEKLLDGRHVAAAKQLVDLREAPPFVEGDELFPRLDAPDADDGTAELLVAGLQGKLVERSIR